MNEQILKLAEQAGLGVQHNGIVLTRNVNAAEAFDQFAQLIVKECINAVENTDQTHAYTTFDKQLIDYTVKKSVQSITKHFNL